MTKKTVPTLLCADCGENKPVGPPSSTGWYFASMDTLPTGVITRRVCASCYGKMDATAQVHFHAYEPSTRSQVRPEGESGRPKKR
jgi:hypothetical protein